VIVIMSSTAFHEFKANGQPFLVPTRYSLIRPIGHGAYGVVISAQDSVSGKKVAIKKIRRAFDDKVDAKRILREIKLMKKFVHENVIRIIDLLPPAPAAEEYEDVYIVQDLMETDLHRIIYSRQPLTIDHIQYFVYQILRGLKYIHSANVLHRDLKVRLSCIFYSFVSLSTYSYSSHMTNCISSNFLFFARTHLRIMRNNQPSNLLLNSNCDLKICDFGLARGVEDEQSGGLTEYVVTRWYRAPEIMLVCQEYTKAIDVWSVGCIFAELLARSPFFPGDDYIAQLRLICEKLGRPDDEHLEFVTSERARRFIASLPNKPPLPMAELFPQHSGETDALDLLRRMLEFHPDRRITIDRALAHPFLASLHNPEDEPVANFTFTFDFENEDLSREKVQELIWQEVRAYHPDIPESPPSATPRRRAKQMLPEAKPSVADAKSESDETDTDSAAGAKFSSRKRSISPGAAK